MLTKYLPMLNACLNGLAGILLFFGFKAIKKGKRGTHKKFMLFALAASALFLVSYITYHFLIHGVVTTHYQRHGFWRFIYFFILSTHTPLAVIIVPFSLIAIWHAYHTNFEKHKGITRWLFPVWMYVSITGVLIYLMLYIFK